MLIRVNFLQVVFVYRREVPFPFPAPKREKVIVTLCLRGAIINKRSLEMQLIYCPKRGKGLKLAEEII